MDSPRTIITEIEAFCAQNGLTPESVCRRATGNPRKWGRLKSKIRQLDGDAERIRAYMAEHHAASSDEVAA